MPGADRAGAARAGRTEALDLLPELQARTIPVTTRRHRASRFGLVLVTVLLVSGLFSGAYARDVLAPDVLEQVGVPVSELPDDDVARYREYAAAGAGVGHAPLVLSYHDIREGADSPYVLDPAAFEAQMQMLSLAGFRSLTLAEVHEYRASGILPTDRTVLITFDDGTTGLWQYADAVLERYDFTAVSFLITGAVDTRRPYYLSWDEIGTMAASGRWEFGSHTHDLHRRAESGGHSHDDADTAAALDPSAPAPGLLARRPLGEGRLEPAAEHHARISADLDASIAAFAAHDLPSPSAFAYPFSEVADATATDALRARFDLLFVNENRDTRPMSHVTGTPRAIERAEVFRGTDADDLFARLQRMDDLALDADALDLLAAEEAGDGAMPQWSTPWRADVPLERDADGALGPTPDAGPWVPAWFAPARTRQWQDYRIDAVVEVPENGEVSVLARAGSSEQSRVRVARGEATVFRGDVERARRDLPVAGSYAVTIEVRRGSTRFLVDDALVAEVGGTASGGTGVLWRADPGTEHGTIRALTVSSLYAGEDR